MPPHINSSHHATIPQLRVDEITVECSGFERVVGFDASHEMQFARANVGDEVCQLQLG